MEVNMIRMMLLLGSFAIATSFATVSRAQDDDGGSNNNVDLSVPYTPHEQTDEERLQNFQPPPPAPPQVTPLDRAANMYQNAPVRPSYDPQMHAPIIQYQHQY